MPSVNKNQSFSYKKQTIDFSKSLDKNANILKQTKLCDFSFLMFKGVFTDVFIT